MSLSIGIVGLPNVGKSTLFNALTRKQVEAANYPFCTIDPSVGVVEVPDTRIWKLSEFSKSAKTIPAIVQFVDIAGLVKGASEGEGLGNQFLTHIRETDAIAHVIRIFEDQDIIHVAGGVDPLFDLEVIEGELLAADKQTLVNRKGNLSRDVKRGDKDKVFENSVVEKLLNHLENNLPARTLKLETDEVEVLKHLHLLTAKPMLYVLNKKAGGKNLDDMNDPKWQALENRFKERRDTYVKVYAAAESEMSEMTGEEKIDIRSVYEISSDGIDDLIKAGYRLLGLISFFTTGKDETRAWTIKQGWTVQQAGSAIHTDFTDKFVRAEVVAWDKLLEIGSYANARAKGLIRTEGKTYIVVDGDVVEYKI